MRKIDRHTAPPIGILEGAEAALLTAVLEVGKTTFGLNWKQLTRQPKTEVDAVIELHHGGKTIKFEVEVKRRLRPATLGVVMHQLEKYGKQALLVTDHVTPPMAEQLRAQGLQFIDAAGNAFLNRPPLYIWVKGERPTTRHVAPRDRGRAFAATGAQVVFTLLCHPEAANWTYREIGDFANVAHGTVGWVMPELYDLQFLADVGGKRRLLNIDRLLQRWAEAYIQLLRPKLVLARFHAPTIGWWNTVKPQKYRYTLGGEAAAGRITKHLQPGTITLYGEAITPQFLLDHKLNKDADGEVEVLKRFWGFEMNDELAPLPLIYADLIYQNDARCLEAAKIIHERFITGFERTR